jgi:transposase
MVHNTPIINPVLAGTVMTLATSSPLYTPDLLWPYPFCQMDWEVTPLAVQDYIRTLQGRIDELQKQVEALQGRVEQTSQTSSKPPSSDSPFKKPKRERRQSYGGKRGARTGHLGTGPTLLTPTEVQG